MKSPQEIAEEILLKAFGEHTTLIHEIKEALTLAYQTGMIDGAKAEMNP